MAQLFNKLAAFISYTDLDHHSDRGLYYNYGLFLIIMFAYPKVNFSLWEQ